MEGVITLLHTETAQNSRGVWEESTTQREVFCNVSSITQREFFEGGRNGLNPEFEVTMFHGDYHGERKCILNGRPYAIYRTFKPETSDYIELYLQREGGTNGHG